MFSFNFSIYKYDLFQQNFNSACKFLSFANKNWSRRNNINHDFEIPCRIKSIIIIQLTKQPGNS